jgi:hypothetical protein
MIDKPRWLGSDRRTRERLAFVPPIGMTTRRYRRERPTLFVYEPLVVQDTQAVTKEEFELSQRVYFRRDGQRGIALEVLQRLKDKGLTQDNRGLWGWDRTSF